MPWNIEHIEHEVFARNPLAVVIAQIRFHPILKVPDRIADLQEIVRGRFPTFQRRMARNIDINDVAGITIREEPQFVFESSDGRAVLFLSTTALGLESRQHESRDEFFGDMKLAVDALNEVHGTFVPTRAGLRYVNAIKKSVISEELGRPVEWEELVADSFLSVPGGAMIAEDTSFSGEVTATVASGGHMTLRHGLISPPGGEERQFRLDFDRYAGASIPADQVLDRFRHFADDIFATFRQSVGPALAEWMNG